MATSAERQAAYRKRKQASGLVSVTVMVPAHRAADMAILAKRLAANPQLEIAALRDVRTGRLAKWY